MAGFSVAVASGAFLLVPILCPMKNLLIAAGVALIIGTLLGVFGTLHFNKCPLPPDNTYVIDSLTMEIEGLIVERNQIVKSVQSLEEEVALARKARQPSVKFFPIYEKAAYDSGLDALQDSLGSSPRD